MANGDKDAGAGQLAQGVGLDIAKFDASDFVLLYVADFFNNAVPDRLNLGIVQHAVDHNFRSPELIAPVNQVNLRSEMSEVGGFFARRIAAANNHERLVAKNWQGPVAGGTVGHAFALERIFARHAEMPVGSADGDDDCFAFEELVVSPELERPAGEIDFGDLDAIFDTRAEALGLLLHSQHQFDTIDAFRKSRKVFHNAGGGEQPARLSAGEQEWFEVGARSINGGGPAGAAGANNNDIFHSE